jgi:hypothetical protein
LHYPIYRDGLCCWRKQTRSETIKGEILSWMKTFKPNDMLCSDIVELWILSVIGLSWLSELYLENWYTQFCTEWCCFLKCRGSPLFF